jgi:hypothetical protein
MKLQKFQNPKFKMHQVFRNPDILSIIINYFQNTNQIISVCKTFYNAYLKDKEYRSNQVQKLRNILERKQGKERLDIYCQIAELGHSLRVQEYKDYIFIINNLDQKRSDLYHIGLCGELMEIYYKNRNVYGLPSPTERNLILFKNIFETGPYLNILVNLLTNKFDRDIYLFVRQEIDSTYWENTDSHLHFDNILHYIEVDNIESFIEYMNIKLENPSSLSQMEWGYLRDKMIQIMASASANASKTSMNALMKTNKKLLHCKRYK